MIGQVIGNYRVIALLGEGGMGVVYRAEHVQLGKQVALKVIQPALSADPTMVQRFFTEARAASGIDHPGIVQVHDFGTHTDGRAYLVMALLRGENLEERLERGTLPATEAITIVAQAAAALAAAHARGIIHRDLKPDNIFLAPNEMIESGTQVVLLDFGIAKLASDGGAGRTQVGALIGTPAYMSPEQCMGRPDLDHRTDLYSLGCILFHALCGRPPFGSDQGTSVMVAAHMLDAPPRPTTLEPRVPSAVEAIVMRLLEKKPEDRFQTANELRDALVRAGARAPLTRPPRDHAGDDPLASTVMAPAGTGATVVSIAPSERRAPTKPTTGGSASGQVTRPFAPRARRNTRRLLVGGGAAIGVVAVTSIVMFTGDDEPGARPAERATTTALPCPLGQVRSEDTAHKCCWPDQAWSTTRGQCIGRPTCPRGMVAREEQCVSDDQPVARPPSDRPDVSPAPGSPRAAEGAPERVGGERAREGEPEKEPTFVLAADPVQPGAVIHVHFSRPIDSQPMGRAWLAVGDPGAPPRQYLDWAFVDHGARTARVRAPRAPGRYEVRLYSNYPMQAHNLVRIVPFTVSRSDAADPGETPTSAWRFTAAPNHKASGEARVEFPSPMRAARGERFWVTVVPEGAFDSSWQVYRYVPEGARDVLLPVPRERGAYEIRLHANYPTRTTNVVHRVKIRVD